MKLFPEHIWEAGKLLTCRYQPFFFFPIDKQLICCSYHVSARKISLSLATTFSVCCNLWNEQTGVGEIMGSGSDSKYLPVQMYGLSAVIYQRSCSLLKKITKTFSNPLTVLFFQKNGRTIVFFEGVGGTK